MLFRSRLIQLTTPVTAKDGGISGLWAQILPVDNVIDSFGNMPAKLIRYTFIALKPYFEVIRWKNFHENLDNDMAMTAFYAVDKWVNDNVDVQGEVFRKIMKEIYGEDRFKHGKTMIHEKPALLSNVTCPVMNIVAEEDWIVTPASACVLNDLIGSEKKILRKIPGQHLSILLHPKNRKVWEEMLLFYKN